MEEKKKDPISDALGITPLAKADFVQTLVADSHNNSAKNDFEKARANIHKIIENGSDAVEKLSQIADQSQHPRAFEVLSKLMETMLQANKDLLDLQKQIRDINAADSPLDEKAKSVTNNLFVGSTAELQKMIENMRNGTTKTNI